MRLFGILGGGWNINFSQQTPGEYEHLTRVHDVAGFQLGRALSLGPGVFIALLRRPRVEPGSSGVGLAVKISRLVLRQK
jgi:hypothetical protein